MLKRQQQGATVSDPALAEATIQLLSATHPESPRKVIRPRHKRIGSKEIFYRSKNPSTTDQERLKINALRWTIDELRRR